MTKKIKILIAVNVVLLFAIALSLMLDDKKGSAVADDQLFSVKDTSLVSKIRLGEQTLVRKPNGIWEVNGKYLAHSDKVTSFLAVMHRLRVKRPLTEQPESMASVPLVMSSDSEELFSANVGQYGSEAWVKGKDGDAYLVYVPGYFINLADMVNTPEQLWRDRRIFRTNWRTLKSLELNYIGDAENSFTISFDSTFYSVKGVTKLDSARLYDYIGNYQAFEVENYVVTREKPVRDSLSKLSPVCTLRVDDLYPSQSGSLDIYAGNTMLGILKNTGEVVVLNKEVLRRVLVNKAFFIRK